MRQARLKAPSTETVAFYHCSSRVVDRQPIFSEPVKDTFVALMKEYARFCGLRLIAWCVMSDHFHVLVEVPSRPETLPTDEDLLDRLEATSGQTGAKAIRQRLELCRRQGQEASATVIRERILSRMWDVSSFIKVLKQRFAAWHNRNAGRRGTLWDARFRSVLVENAPTVLATMAAYIDLNPVRANLVADPKDYRWSSYGAAMAGDSEARSAYERAFGEALRKGQDVLAVYRAWLLEPGSDAPAMEAGAHPQRFDRSQAGKVLASRQRMGLADYLRCRVRYFGDGLVLGSKPWVEKVFEIERSRFGPKRRDGARRMRGVEGELYTLRDLQVDVVS